MNTQAFGDESEELEDEAASGFLLRTRDGESYGAPSNLPGAIGIDVLARSGAPRQPLTCSRTATFSECRQPSSSTTAWACIRLSRRKK